VAARDAVRKAAKSESQRIEAVTVDVADAAAVQALSDKVFAECGRCHFLMNNAGVNAGGGVLAPLETMQTVMNINTFGPIHGVVAFLPKMKEHGEPGLIVNTGSKQGITMPPGNTVYNMSKAALKCYTEALEHDLGIERRMSGGKLRAALLVPGWTNTSIVLKTARAKAEAEGTPFDKDSVFFHEDKPASGAWMPSQVVDFMLEELAKGRFYIMCPDNECDRETDNLRMTWTMQDITQDRPPLSRWHPEYKDKFNEFLQEQRGKQT